MSEFSDIMEESHDSIKITDKTEWWQSRWKLDDRLRVRLTQIQNKFSTNLGNVKHELRISLKPIQGEFDKDSS